MPIQETGLGINSDKLIARTFAIIQDRDRYFNDLINQIRKRYPALKILYANNMMGAKLDADRPNPDFVIIMKGELVSKDPSLPKKPIILLDMPMIFTDRALAGWTISVENNNIKGYFDYMLDKCLRIDESKFYEFIQYMALLSLDPKSDRYWKKAENTEALIKDLEELYVRYRKKSSSALQDKRGYQTSPNSNP